MAGHLFRPSSLGRAIHAQIARGRQVCDTRPDDLGKVVAVHLPWLASMRVRGGFPPHGPESEIETAGRASALVVFPKTGEARRLVVSKLTRFSRVFVSLLLQSPMWRTSRSVSLLPAIMEGRPFSWTRPANRPARLPGSSVWGLVLPPSSRARRLKCGGRVARQAHRADGETDVHAQDAERLAMAP